MDKRTGVGTEGCFGTGVGEEEAGVAVEFEEQLAIHPATKTDSTIEAVSGDNRSPRNQHLIVFSLLVRLLCLTNVTSERRLCCLF